MKYMKILMVLSAVCVFFASEAPAVDRNITIKGSTTILPISQRTAEVFMGKNPEINMSVQGGGSSVGIVSLIDGTADIGQASRPMRESEIERAQRKKVSPKMHIIAMDGITVVVHPTNAVNRLTIGQIRDIYLGKISDWSEVGAQEREIVVVSRDSSSGTYEQFSIKALGGARTRPDSLLQASNQAVAQTVAMTPGAIGYIGLGYVSDRVKPLKVNGVRCTKETVMSNRYPLSRFLFMYTDGDPSGEVKQYLDFVLSQQGQRIVENCGYVSLFH
ncbi:MAG: phosphate ABC transporter substrate-binding protein PstS family protein [Candidatus Omnitrophica bacterium]|nr:phosphate ABC transporter substrate-binding protein PstS family protein [Candidatus Omnitrophota bacterium]